MKNTIITHNLNYEEKRFEPKSTKCKFCYNDAYSISMEDNHYQLLFKEKNRTNLIIYSDVSFNQVKIGIPRCPRCHKIHKVVFSFNLILMFICIIASLFILVSLKIEGRITIFEMILLMAAMFGGTVLLLMMIERFVFNRFEMNSTKEGAEDDPLINEFLNNGWSLKAPTA